MFITYVVLRHFTTYHDITHVQTSAKKAPEKGAIASADACCQQSEKTPSKPLYAALRVFVTLFGYQAQMLVICHGQINHHAVAGGALGALEL